MSHFVNIGAMENLAEICGIHAGDGYLRNSGSRVELDISGSLEEEAYYIKRVIPLFFSCFGVKPKGRVFPSRNTYGFVIRDSGIVSFIHELGFPYGRKASKLRAPKFVLESNDMGIISAFLRGVLDTDGCISFDKRYSESYSTFKRTYHTYPRLKLTTISKDFCNDLKTLLKRLEIREWTQTYVPKAKNESTKYIIWIRGKEVKKWMELIGSGNPIKMSRFEIWKKCGFCPPKTTYKYRLKILNNIKDPRLAYGPVAQLDRAPDSPDIKAG